MRIYRNLSQVNILKMGVVLIIAILALFGMGQKAKASEPVKSEMYIGDYEFSKDSTGYSEIKYVESVSGKIVKERKAGETSFKKRYYYTDHQGSSVSILDEQGAKIPEQVNSKLRYFPYGEQITSQDTTKLPLDDTYTGQKKDSESDLMFYNARLYDPSSGVFLQADSVNDGMNKYIYVAGNPVNNVDLDGKKTTNVICDFMTKLGYKGFCTLETGYYNDFYINNVTNDSKMTEENAKTVQDGLDYFPKSFIKNLQLELYNCSDRSSSCYKFGQEQNKLGLLKVDSDYANRITANGRNYTAEEIIHEMGHIVDNLGIYKYSSRYGMKEATRTSPLNGVYSSFDVFQSLLLSGDVSFGKMMVSKGDRDKIFSIFKESHNDSGMKLSSNLNSICGIGDYCRKDFGELFAVLTAKYLLDPSRFDEFPMLKELFQQIYNENNLNELINLSADYDSFSDYSD